jgi:hypothetical protein
MIVKGRSGGYKGRFPNAQCLSCFNVLSGAGGFVFLFAAMFAIIRGIAVR